MKKRELNFSALVAFGSVLLIAGGAYAAEKIITVTAIIPAWAVIEPSTVSARLMLDGRLGAPDYNATLLTLNLSHNSDIGYTIEMRSANDGQLIGVSDETKKIGYQISYDSQAPIVLTHTPQNVGGATTSAAGSGIAPFMKTVNIIVTNEAANAATNQEYEDTITFTLTGM